jgi:hypothetical protein
MEIEESVEMSADHISVALLQAVVTHAETTFEPTVNSPNANCHTKLTTSH